MPVLSYIFTTMKWFGIWRPVEWSSEWKINLYWSYTFIVVFALSFKILSKIVYLVKFLEDPDEVANSLFLALTEACTVYKIANILNSRRDIILYTDKIVDGLCKPNGHKEANIQTELDRRIRLIERMDATLNTMLLLICTELFNKIFSRGILVQYAVSTFVMCCSIYTLSRVKPFSTEFVFMAAYMACMLTQLFLYCWHGNEVLLESLNVRDAVYAMNWRKLKLRTQKCLLIVMDCTLEPIKFTSADIIVLSLDTYKNLIKLSYSMYNLLKQSSEH